MTFDDLEMINLRQTVDWKWSFSAYRKPFTLWRSNKDLPYVFVCMEQIMQCIAQVNDEEVHPPPPAELTPRKRIVRALKPPAGEKSKPAKLADLVEVAGKVPGAPPPLVAASQAIKVARTLRKARRKS